MQRYTPASRPVFSLAVLGLLSLATLVSGVATASPRGPHEPAPSAGQLQRELESLRVVGSVLYVAAHPDDENTRLIAYLEGERGLDVTYLSLTRGGGGQNLIGTEQGELLGVLRTHELLSARQIDGGRQRFTRARDFGYSKSADEALQTWGHETVLQDVVDVVREVQPDVVIARFPTEGSTHGHHLASAILAGEAFERAGESADGWSADRLLRNESSWRIDEDTDTSGWLSLDVGTYDPLTGRSWTEVAADARTMHKSQGFGSRPRVGPTLEYFSAVAGDVPPPGEDVFAGLDLSWSRFEGGKRVDALLSRALRRFDPAAPHLSVPQLFAVREAIGALPAPAADRAVVRDARARLDRLILDCAGVWLSLRTEQGAVTPGGTLPVELQGVVRSPVDALPGVSYDVELLDESWSGTLSSGLVEEERFTSVPSGEEALTRPQWLKQQPTPALYADASSGADPLLTGRAVITFGEVGAVTLSLPVEHVWTDPVHGERRQPVEVLPPVTATFGQRTRLVPLSASSGTSGSREEAAVPFSLTLRAHGPLENTRTARVTLTTPPGSRVEPTELEVSFTDDARETLVALDLFAGTTSGSLVATVTLEHGDHPDSGDSSGDNSREDVGGGPHGWSFAADRIDHPHVPMQTVLSPAQVDIVPVALDRGGVDRVAYIAGSGDAVPTALRDLGYTVDLVDLDAVREGGLDSYDVAMLGIRAFNTVDGLLENRAVLYDWVEGGGRLVVQYNTSNRWRDLGDVGPKRLTIDRGRVTDENALITPIDPENPVLMGPNALSDADWKGWVQERGLYFAEEWDPAYTPVFRMNDAGEEPLEGALLTLQHGEGTFVYTGISFFRQLPAGVPGAARLLANLLAFDAAEPR